MPAESKESIRSWSVANTAPSVDKPSVCRRPPAEKTADPTSATGLQQSVAAWEDTSSLTPTTPRAVKMPTFGRVVVVFASAFWQASLSDGDNSPLTLIVTKCGGVWPTFLCVCVCVCSVPNVERLTQPLLTVKPLFQIPVVPSQGSFCTQKASVDSNKSAQEWREAAASWCAFVWQMLHSGSYLVDLGGGGMIKRKMRSLRRNRMWVKPRTFG